ncbi:MAG TPA: aminotransferase class I/II-fold pyridoxal phosphate-dependent enzyme, partial [Candidatus Binataceae bacterium]
AGRLQGQNSGNPSSISQAAAIEALNGPQGELPVMLKEFRARREFVVERARSIKGIALPNVPAGAFYAFLNVSALIGKRWSKATLSDGNSVAEFLLEEGRVSTVGGNDFGAPNHIRISYATSLAKLKEAFDRIERAIKTLG